MEGSSEIPSQLDDLNRDRKMDELAFVTSLPAHGRKTFQVTLSSEKSTKTYPARVYAEMFIADPRKGKHQSVQAITVPGTSNIYSMVRPHGPVLESELVGYRLYFNENRRRISTVSSIKDWKSKNLNSILPTNSWQEDSETMCSGYSTVVVRVLSKDGTEKGNSYHSRRYPHGTYYLLRSGTCHRGNRSDRLEVSKCGTGHDDPLHALCRTP